MTWHQVVLGASSQVAGEKECPCNVQCQTGRLGLLQEFPKELLISVYCVASAWAWVEGCYENGPGPLICIDLF